MASHVVIDCGSAIYFDELSAIVHLWRPMRCCGS
jgi:pantothenate kinase type III